MAFRGGGFPAQRQPSNSSTPSLAPLPLQSPSLGRAGQNQGSFPFGAAGVAMSPPPGNTQGSAPGGPETNLDISDFPALGSGISAAISTPSLLSSYASQAGTGLLPTTAAAGFLPNGAVLGNAPTGSVVPGNAREFSADDFPALGGFGGGEMGLGAANGQQSNGMSFLAGMGGGVGAGRTGAQEQASAVAALQHQQQQNQHRANLLGSMNGAAGQGQDGHQSRNVSGGPGFLAEGDKRALALKQANVVSPGGQQPWASSPNSQSFPPNSLPLSNGNGLAAPSPSTFPPGSQPTAEQQQQHQAQQQQQHQQQQLNQQQYQQQQLQQLQQQQLQQQQQQSQQGLNQQQMRSPPMQSAQGPPLSTSLPPGVAPSQPQRTVGSTGAPATATPALQVPSTNSLLPPTSQPTAKTPQTPAQQVLFSPADRFGLLGLLHIIKTSDPDISMLALGSDLTTLGLDLGATENLYSTFITPWSDSKAALALNIEPEFHLPSCYNVQPPPAGTKIGNFSDETLFFIFYSQPRDSMQDFAAHELYKHNWRYHKDLRLWLTKEAGTEPTQKTQSYERGSYIHFDPVLWERTRKDHVLVFDSLERRT